MPENVKIAIIDDEEPVRESFNLILQIKDYDLDFYEKATDFIGKFSKGQYDIAFLDLFLKNDPPPFNRPTKDGGLEALKKIKEIDPEIQIIIVTAYHTDEKKLNAITYGALDYLRKPFMMEEIYELVERGLRRRRTKKTQRKDLGPTGPIH
jgi:DNA-binding NtrC family response regulator